MGTTVQLKLYASDDATANAASRSAFARVVELNAALSDYLPTSELNELCRNSARGPQTVSADLYAVLKKADDVSRHTGGAFDVTVGPVVKLWRRARRTQRFPDKIQLTEARSKVGFEKLKFDDDRRTVELTVEGMQLDLGGIAKGYAADEMLKVLRQRGVTRAMVAIGGDVVAGDAPPGTVGWEVAILTGVPGEKPPPPLKLANRAASTSGDVEQFVEIDGVRYAHVIDPRTGVGLTCRFAVTVVAADGTTSDAYATALAVVGPVRGAEMIENLKGVAARFVVVGPDGVEVKLSRGFEVK